MTDATPRPIIPNGFMVKMLALLDEYAQQHADTCTEALRAERDRLAVDAARGRYMLKHGSWHRGEEQTHLAVLVPQGSDLSCYAMREAAIDAAREKP
jgi:hypothetical protein